MNLLDRIKKRFNGKNGAQERETEQSCKSLKEIDTTIIDADERIEKMLEEMRAD